jgi:hypothetical protein
VLPDGDEEAETLTMDANVMDSVRLAAIASGCWCWKLPRGCSTRRASCKASNLSLIVAATAANLDAAVAQFVKAIRAPRHLEREADPPLI